MRSNNISAGNIMTGPRVRITAHFVDLLASADLSYAELARRSGVGESTIRAAVKPHHHRDRRGGIWRRTAWKVARTYAQATSTSEEQAFRLLFEDFEELETTKPALAAA